MPGLQHAQRTRRRIARIGETGQPVLLAVGIQTLERPPVHHDFAAHFKAPVLDGHSQRQRADGARIFRDVFARAFRRLA